MSDAYLGGYAGGYLGGYLGLVAPVIEAEPEIGLTFGSPSTNPDRIDHISAALARLPEQFKPGA